MSTLDTQAVYDMVSDWLATPVNGYLGSNYGQDLKRLLHTPLSTQLGDAQLAKLRGDVPVLDLLPEGAVNLYKATVAHDRLMLYVEVAGRILPYEER